MVGPGSEDQVKSIRGILMTATGFVLLGMGAVLAYLIWSSYQEAVQAGLLYRVWLAQRIGNQLATIVENASDAIIGRRLDPRGSAGSRGLGNCRRDAAHPGPRCGGAKIDFQDQ